LDYTTGRGRTGQEIPLFRCIRHPISYRIAAVDGIPSILDDPSGSSQETSGQTATRILRDKILAGDLDPGTKLNQHHLAAELGMSRIPVRDALRSLASEGLVEVRAHTTAVVSSLSTRDLQELYELRIAIEPSLGRLAVPGLTERHLEEMQEFLHALEGTEATTDWLALNNRFHETMYSAAGRRRSLDMVRTIRRQTDRYTAVYVELNHPVVDAEHRMIYEAAKAGQSVRLEALLTAHISGSYEQMLRYLSEQETGWELRDHTGETR
jgi:DNA-binding GntR family transcriptional regulator